MSTSKETRPEAKEAKAGQETGKLYRTSAFVLEHKELFLPSPCSIANSERLIGYRVRLVLRMREKKGEY